MTAGLDINTPKGQVSLKYEKIMLRKIENRWGVEIIETYKKGTARCDGIISKNKKLVGVEESKCRDMSLMKLRNYGSWLITHQKILNGQILSSLLKVPFMGFLYLVPDDITLYWKITDKDGKFNFKYDINNTTTQKTINGGTIVRENAFLPYKYAYEIP